MRNNKAVPLIIKEQLKWTLWFLGILYLVRVAAHFINLFFLGAEFNIVLLNFAYEPSKVYMLVIGLVSVYTFLGFCIEHGLTRRHYYQAALLSSAAIALVITAAIAVFNLMDTVIFNTNASVFYLIDTDTLFEVLLPGSAAYFVTVLLYYLLGMFIASGFYRFGWLTGLGFIAAGILFLLIESLIWGTEFVLFDIGVITEGLPVFSAVLATAFLAGVVYTVSAKSLKDTPVKIV
ncbi:hypothetical protein CHL76_06160 [Marinococcus halophilus]|uniref:Uncharacterized protein n=1 Tax=Marinococcus halophilus TaxID=1371 RepID=A0A510Y3R4_MARHA|nr:hypothetical protein [Marinococcus halophilus]OZT80910.1 hypothetical protein CHL76_06160 [Marinococcus halophilus]GEK57968.1 hypothetical protein MHA01_08730 [Marinococcus halophilus]